jgi:hypothetical protein
MKTRIFNTLLVGVIFLFSTLYSSAEIVKKVHKSWPIGKVTSLAIENKFGNINFVSNRNDSVTIDVSIDTDMESRHSYRLVDQIDFSFSISDGKVNAKTIFDDGFSSHDNFTINYIINIPTNRDLEVINKYGNVMLDDLEANGNFEIAYGSINGNSLMAPTNQQIKLELKYANANFEKINSLLGDISYSKLRATNIENAELETRYSTIFSEKSNDIFANSRYDNYTILSIKRIKADSKFTDWKIDEATSSVQFINEYGDIKIRKVPKNFEKVSVQNRYGNIRIGIANDASYQLVGETFYCNIIFPDTEPDKYIKEENHTIINAFIGNRNATSKVNIESRYGKVDLLE